MNFYDILFARKLAGGGGDIPPHSYQLKSISPTPTPIATFPASALPMPSLTVGIEAVQAGSGDPSPENVRPISGFTEANVVVSPTTDAEDGTTYNIQFKDGDNPLTVYGGSFDVVSGVLTVDRAYFKYINVSTTSGIVVTNGWRCNFTCPIDDINRGKWSIQTDATPIFNKISTIAKGYGANEYTVILPNVTSKEEADAMLEGLEICYKLATPQTIQLTPTAVKSLLGTNNLWANSGDITEGSYFVAI